MHVVVATCAHRGDDARIVHRQIRSLLEAGHRVTLVAPMPPAESAVADPAGLVRVDVPRAVGRRRLRSWWAVRRAVRRLLDPTAAASTGVPRGQLLLLHDPELVPWFARRRAPVPVVWDVHEDYVASITDRRYIPTVLRAPVRWCVERLEQLAVRRCHLILAEDAYAERLGSHPVVPNATWVPGQLPEADGGVDTDAAALPRIVYAGRISTSRGAQELIELGRRLAGRATVELIGDADADVADAVRAAARRGDVVWRGYLPNPLALERVQGALAGLSMLHDLPNYRHSRPTKLVEYLAQGVPVITTPLPLAVDLVASGSAGAVVGFDTAVDDTVATVESWLADPVAHRRAAVTGHAFVLEHHSWQAHSQEFVALLQRWAAAESPPT